MILGVPRCFVPIALQLVLLVGLILDFNEVVSSSSLPPEGDVTDVIKNCPIGCRCDGWSFYCEERSFLGLGLPVEARDVVLRNVRAATLPLTALEQAGKLQSLAWISSDIERVESGAFQPTPLLESLNLGDNRLSALPIDVLRPLTNLRRLNLTSNRLVSLPRALFHGLERLEELVVSNNRLSVLPFQAFTEARSLNRLDVSRNFLVSLPDHTFKTNRELLVLRLSGNRLTKLPGRLFSGLQKIQRLELADNEIDSLPRGLFNELATLEYLDLSGNPLTNLSNVAFHGLNSLVWLDISRTKLTRLTTDLWRPVKNLRSLNVSKTPIEILGDLDLAGLRRLESLTMTDSSLREIGSKTLDETPFLRSLDLRDNDLTFLPANLAHLTRITQIQLGGNPWACDCRMFWFIKWAESHAHRTAFDSGLRCAQETETVDTLYTLRYLNCTAPYVEDSHFDGEDELHPLLGTVLLECDFNGNPVPTVTWVTPTLEVFHFIPEPEFPDVFHDHPSNHREIGLPLSDDHENADYHAPDRIRVLENGSLLISRLLRRDVGRYKCYAVNPIANVTAYVYLRMDPVTYHRIKIFSIAVGAASATGFLLLTLFVQFLRYLIGR